MRKIIIGFVAALILAGGSIAMPSAQAARPTAAVISGSVAPAPATRAISPLRGSAPFKFGTKRYSKWYARHYMKTRYGWKKRQYRALVKLFEHESGWSHRSANRSSGAYGIPQALPAHKLSQAGRDWRTNPEPQIRWGLKYIKSRYGTPKRAWAAWTSKRWY